MAVVASLSAGCSSDGPGPIDIWAGDDVYHAASIVGQDDPGGIYDAQANRVTLVGAVAETLGFCLVLSAADTAIADLDLSSGDLRFGDTRIPAGAITLYRVHDIEPNRLPGWHIRLVEPQDRVSRVPDVLVPVDAPIGGLPVDLAPGASLSLWVDVNIPKGTAPGTYVGQLQARSGEQIIATVGLRVTVWPFVLPGDVDLALLGELDHRALFANHVFADGRAQAPRGGWADNPAAAELDDVLRTTARLLHAHRVSILLPRLRPNVKVDGEGRLTIDWTEYDRVADPLLTGRAFYDRQPLPLWQLPFDEEFPTPPSYGALASPTYSKLATRYLSACASHFAEQDSLQRCFVALPCPQTPDTETYRAVRHFGQIVRNADDRLASLAPIFPQDMSMYGWHGFVWEDVARQVDIWSPPAQFFEPSAMQQQRLRGKRTFWTMDRPPFSGSTGLLARPADTRVIGWQARAYDLEAVRLGTVNNWPTSPEPLTPQQCCDAGPAPVIYPGRCFGRSSPVPSVRLKRLRRSMQDVAYLNLLDSLGREHVGAALTKALAPRAAADAYGAHCADGVAGGWLTDPKLWALGRQIMADEIVRAIGQRASGRSNHEGSPTDDMAGSVQWRRLMDATQRLDVRVDGVRARSLGPGDAEPIEVAVSVTLANRTRTPLSGQLAFEKLPIAWTGDPAEIEVAPIAPQASRRLTLRALATAMETDAGAVRYLPMVLTTSTGQTHRFSARLAFLAPTPLPNVPIIDGDLSDWPAAVGNVAEDFILVTGEDPRIRGQLQARPTQATQCFTAVDDQAVYFAFNCSTEFSSKLPLGLRNVVEYEDGVPVGEELIEILIDPANAGTRSTSDLYHVVIKPNGWLCERGVATDPPTGVREPWPADISAVVQIHPDRWVAEVRIPRDAFDTRSTGRTVWGVNVTRFDLARQEFANWSGATGNVYDPLSLGNLALPW